MVPGLLKLPASPPYPESSQFRYQQKKGIIELQKNMGFVKSKTGQESGTLAEDAPAAAFGVLQERRPDMKWDNSGTSGRR